MLTMYGITNCDTIKKARRWLEQHQIDYQFHDYRRDGLDLSLLKDLVAEFHWQTLINTRGSSWRKLDVTRRETICDEQSAIQLMLEIPAIIKRPLLRATGKSGLSGFSETRYREYCATGDV